MSEVSMERRPGLFSNVRPLATLPSPHHKGSESSCCGRAAAERSNAKDLSRCVFVLIVNSEQEEEGVDRHLAWDSGASVREDQERTEPHHFPLSFPSC